MAPTISFPAPEPETSMTSRGYAQMLDRNDPLRDLRSEFRLPQKSTVKKSVNAPDSEEDPVIYFAGNGIGLQPRAVPKFVQHYLQQWGTQGSFAALAQPPDSPALSWAKIEPEAARQMSEIVGAKPEETVLMAGLTTSLHLLMASFFRPSGKRTKIIVEREAFSSDFFAVESQLAWHGLDLKENMVLIDSDPLIPTERVLETIDAHADTTAFILLSGVQYVTGQLLDIPRITAHARSKGILICWDLAHAAGNVELKLHNWNVDLAVWCTYKYMNCGPGAIGGTFVHERHGSVDLERGTDGWRPRLAGWWGGLPQERFKMENNFRPSAGAAGFQVSNVSILELTSVLGSLSVFRKTSMSALREKSILLTGYLEYLLKTEFDLGGPFHALFKIQTPREPEARGASLSLEVDQKVLDKVTTAMEQSFVVVDVRRPNIMRVTPVPLYNTFDEVWRFVEVFKKTLQGTMVVSE